jgi:hypothetical protein
MVEQLHASGKLDEAAKAELVANLEKSDPAIWPQLMSYFQASLDARRSEHRPVDVEAATPDESSSSPTRATRDIRPTAYNPLRAPRTAVADRRLTDERELDNEAPATRATYVDRRLSDDREFDDEPAPRAAVVDRRLREEPSAPRPAPARRAAHVERESIDETPPPDLAERISNASTYDVTSASDATSASDDWQKHLQAATEALAAELADERGERRSVESQARLRLLHLAAGERDDALRPLTGANSAVQDFWSKQVYGLAAWLDTSRTANGQRRATEAVAHLREAADRLAEAANLRVRNLALCTKVSGFGDFRRFEKHEFNPGQEVVVYAEVENFASRQSGDGCQTELACTIELLDRHGERVAEKQLKVRDDRLQHPRRDLFVSANFWMPQRLAVGSYTLQLRVEDQLAEKTDQASLELTIK